MRHCHRVVWTGSHEFHLLPFQCRDRREFWGVPGAAVANATIGGGATAVDHALVRQDEQMLVAYSDLPDPAIDGLELRALVWLLIVSLEAIHNARLSPFLVLLYRGLA